MSLPWYVTSPSQPFVLLRSRSRLPAKSLLLENSSVNSRPPPFFSFLPSFSGQEKFTGCFHPQRGHSRSSRFSLFLTLLPPPLPSSWLPTEIFSSPKSLQFLRCAFCHTVSPSLPPLKVFSPEEQPRSPYFCSAYGGTPLLGYVGDKFFFSFSLRFGPPTCHHPFFPVGEHLLPSAEDAP